MENRKIFLLRHGHIQTKEDKKFFIGQTDCSLSIKGLEQIKKTGEFIKDIDLKHIVCSCLKRSIKSAEIIAEHHDIKVKSYQALNEINLGEWDGLSFDEVKEKYPDEFKKRGEDIVNYRVKGAENFFDLKKRVMKQFYEIINNFEGNILITAHAGVNRVIL